MPAPKTAISSTVARLLRSDPGSPDDRRPIVLLHGFASSPRVLIPLQRHLQRDLGRDVLPVAISPGLRDLRDSAQRVNERIAALVERRRVEGADIVAHSMGGLVATWALKRLDLGERVRTVVTLGTPHRGTPVAHLGAPLLGSFCPALGQMLPGSALVNELKWLPVPRGSELVSISGARDRFVPERCARLTPLPGHRNVRVGGAHHWSLLLSRAVFSLVGEVLADAQRCVGGIEALPAPIRFAHAA